MSEVRYAIRQLLKSPGFTLVAILGLSASAAVSRTRPAGQIELLNEAQSLTRVGFSYSRYAVVQEQQQVFSDLALSIGNAFTLTGRRRKKR